MNKLQIAWLIIGIVDIISYALAVAAKDDGLQTRASIWIACCCIMFYLTSKFE